MERFCMNWPACTTFSASGPVVAATIAALAERVPRHDVRPKSARSRTAASIAIEVARIAGCVRRQLEIVFRPRNRGVIEKPSALSICSNTVRATRLFRRCPSHAGASGFLPGKDECGAVLAVRHGGQ
jgi:hypothetical protein